MVASSHMSSPSQSIATSLAPPSSSPGSPHAWIGNRVEPADAAATDRRAASRGRRRAGETAGAVIFLGLDGADWSLLDRYIARRHHAEAREAGAARARAERSRRSTRRSLRSIWTTMLTGVSPLEHRILDFLRVNPVSGKREPITSDERQAPADLEHGDLRAASARRRSASGRPIRPKRSTASSSRIACSRFLY